MVLNAVISKEYNEFVDYAGKLCTINKRRYNTTTIVHNAYIKCQKYEIETETEARKLLRFFIARQILDNKSETKKEHMQQVFEGSIIEDDEVKKDKLNVLFQKLDFVESIFLDNCIKKSMKQGKSVTIREIAKIYNINEKSVIKIMKKIKNKAQNEN